MYGVSGRGSSIFVYTVQIMFGNVYICAALNDAQASWRDERYRVGWSTPHEENGVENLETMRLCCCYERVPHTEDSWRAIDFQHLPSEVKQSVLKILREAKGAIQNLQAHILLGAVNNEQSTPEKQAE